jgi:hypothetical protein
MSIIRRTPYVALHARTVPARGITEATPADQPFRVARGILIMALVLGSVGAEAAVASGYASTHQAPGTTILAPSATSATSGAKISNPWMY